MNHTAERLAATAKSSMEVSLALANAMHTSVEKLVELNMTTFKTALGESFAHAKAVLSAKDVQELTALQANFAKPFGEKSAAYAQDIQEIVADAGAEFTRATQANLADALKGFSTVMESATSNAPHGTETAVAIFTKAMTGSQDAFKTAQTATQQAIETSQSNLIATSKQAVDSVKKATKTE